MVVHVIAQFLHIVKLLVQVITHEKDLHVGIERQIYKASSHFIPQPGA